ncbi:MAG: DUF4339 domain-containing protein [Verrucomicrobiae bacterium]|nr:DUF4339 domain-containing protein [Verrucomicrobiae bacterium]
MEWYYLDANQQQIPADENDLAGLVENGSISGETLLWNESMSDWQSAAALFPTWFPAAAPESVPAPAAPVLTRATPKLAAGKAPSIGMVKRPIQTVRGGATLKTSESVPDEAFVAPVDNRELIKDLAAFIAVNVGWIKFLGVMSIISGISTCLTGVGILIGWIPIWLGVILFKVANTSTAAQYQGHQVDLEDSLDRIALYFKLQGIFMLVGLIMTVVMVVLFFVLGLGAMLSLQQGMQGMEGLQELPGMESTEQ